MEDEDKKLDDELEDDNDETDTADDEQDDEFEYDEDGNIIIPDVVDDEDEDGDEPVDLEEEQDETDDSAAADEGADDGKKSEVVEPDAEDEKDKRYAELEKKYKALESQGKETLSKLGVKTENVLEGFERLAAEADDTSLEEYQKKKAETAKNDEAQRLLQQLEFEKKTKADLEELKKFYPETQKLTSIFQIENLAEFGRLRDLGLSPKQAYAAANADKVKASAVTAARQAAINDTKNHLKSTVPKGSKDEAVTMTKKQLAEWRDIFPDKSDKEIVKLYKDTLKK